MRENKRETIGKSILEAFQKAQRNEAYVAKFNGANGMLVLASLTQFYLFPYCIFCLNLFLSKASCTSNGHASVFLTVTIAEFMLDLSIKKRHEL
jgi:hypothetical protein